MRNPYYVEVRLENEGIYALKNDKSGIIIKDFSHLEESKNKELNEIP